MRVHKIVLVKVESLLVGPLMPSCVSSPFLMVGHSFSEHIHIRFVAY